MDNLQDYLYRRLNYVGLALLPWSGAAPDTLHLNFDLNSGCNIKCIMCSQKDGFARQTVVPLEKFRSNIVSLFEQLDYFQYGCLYEPLMYPHFEESVDLIAGRMKEGCVGTLVCNGTLLDERKRKKLVDSGVFKKVRISFDGATRETFELIRAGAKFDRVIANVAALADYRDSQASSIQIEFNCTIMRQNIRELSSLIRLAKELGVNSVSTHKLHPDDYGSIEADYYLQIQDSQAEAYAVAEEMGISFSGQEYSIGPECEASVPTDDARACRFHLDRQLTMILSPDGKLHTPCRQIVMALGNLLTDESRKIFSSRNYRLLQYCVAHPNRKICPMCYLYCHC